MQWLELNNVEYGDCTVLGGKSHSILMVDCGSMNQKLRNPEMDMSDVFTAIRERYGDMTEKHFLLTHYHRDHLCGLLQILRESPSYFDRVYIPYLPKDAKGNSPLLDFAIFARAFLPVQTDCSQVNTSCLGIFNKLKTSVGADRIFTLKAGEFFFFDSVPYEVLSPAPEGFVFGDTFTSAVEDMNICLSNPFLKNGEGAFLEAKNAFVAGYYRSLDAFSPKDRKSPTEQADCLLALDELFEKLEIAGERLALSPAGSTITELLGQQTVREAYSEATNAASVIFHNFRKSEASFDDLLMTGDATNDALQSIYEKLYGSYYIVKAPHHGTQSGYSSILKEMGIGHLLISSGDYHAGGDIAPEYTALETVKHCTNTVKCKWFTTSGGCCNRLNYCYDQADGPGLTIRCSATKFSREQPACGIYVVAPRGGRSCFCDVRVVTDRIS